MEKRNSKVGVTEDDVHADSRREQAVEAMVSSGSSLNAIKVARAKPSAANKASSNPLGTNGSPFFSVSDVTLEDSLDASSNVSKSKAIPKPTPKPTPKFQSQLNNQMFLTNNHANSAQACLNMDYIMTAFILEGGLPFTTVLNPNLKRLITAARMLPAKYTLPSRNKISGPYMDILYDQRISANETVLLRDKEIFGLGFYCDGATIGS
jgi:hypothetical protein